MCIYVCRYVCVCVYIYIYIYTHTHTYTEEGYFVTSTFYLSSWKLYVTRLIFFFFFFFFFKQSKVFLLLDWLLS